MASINNFTVIKKHAKSKKIGIAKYIIENEYKWNTSLTELIKNKGDFKALEIYQKYGL